MTVQTGTGHTCTVRVHRNRKLPSLHPKFVGPGAGCRDPSLEFRWPALLLYLKWSTAASQVKEPHRFSPVPEQAPFPPNARPEEFLISPLGERHHPDGQKCSNTRLIIVEHAEQFSFP
jgi:hypothetical protein